MASRSQARRGQDGPFVTVPKTPESRAVVRRSKGRSTKARGATASQRKRWTGRRVRAKTREKKPGPARSRARAHPARKCRAAAAASVDGGWSAAGKEQRARSLRVGEGVGLAPPPDLQPQHPFWWPAAGRRAAKQTVALRLTIYTPRERGGGGKPAAQRPVTPSSIYHPQAIAGRRGLRQPVLRDRPLFGGGA